MLPMLALFPKLAAQTIFSVALLFCLASLGSGRLRRPFFVGGTLFKGSPRPLFRCGAPLRGSRRRGVLSKSTSNLAFLIAKCDWLQNQLLQTPLRAVARLRRAPMNDKSKKNSSRCPFCRDFARCDGRPRAPPLEPAALKGWRTFRLISSPKYGIPL